MNDYKKICKKNKLNVWKPALKIWNPIMDFVIEALFL